MAERLAAALRSGPALGLLTGPQAHLDWLGLLWGPRFDREAALQLAGPHPAGLGQMLDVANRFDALPGPLQQRLRRLILRHHLRALPRMAHAAHLAD